MSSQQADSAGTRDNLTPAQTRALFRLWHRFFRLCELSAGSLSANNGNNHHSSFHPSASSVSLATSQTGTDGRKRSSKRAGEASAQTQESAPGELNDSPSDKDSRLYRTASTPLMASQDPASAGGSYGKPLQRQVSNVRQIDERGGHIPKDDRVKDELKTLEEAKEMREFLERYGGERLRQIFWEMVKGEHPDAVMLRFLRARKWNVDRAIAVIGSTAAFRADNNVTEIVRGGELALTRTRGGMNMLANGISYIYGATAIGEPVYFIEVGNHYSHNQTQQELKKGVIFLQELLQMMMPPPIERKVVIFNMNDFGIRNMDWWCVFFMVKTMESYYVETLSRVYVHGAPWIFKPIWAILKPLLDPVVRDKVRLTFSAEELAEHVPFTHLPKDSMRGGMDWTFDYPPPDPQENDKQFETKKIDELQEQYMGFAREFEQATKELANMYARASLIRKGGAAAKRAGQGAQYDIAMDEEDDEEEDAYADGEVERVREKSGGLADAATLNHQRERLQKQTSYRQTALRNAAVHGMADDNGSTHSRERNVGGDSAANLRARRDVLATKLRVAFLKLRPYIVGKSMVERWGAFKEDGRIVWRYRSVDGEEEEQVLGLGTTLPELEQNLELIEQASRQATSSDEPFIQDAEANGAALPSAADRTGERGSGADPDSSVLGSPRSTTEMNRRQQRLMTRSRPTSKVLDPDAVNATKSEDKEDRRRSGLGRSDVPDGTGQVGDEEFDAGTRGSEDKNPSDPSAIAASGGGNPVPVHPLSTNAQAVAQVDEHATAA